MSWGLNHLRATKEYSKISTLIGLLLGMQSVAYYINYILLFKTVNNWFEKVREVRDFHDFLKFIYQISMEFRNTHTFMQRFLQSDKIFYDQFIVSRVNFGKCFAEFMIHIALLKGLEG